MRLLLLSLLLLLAACQPSTTPNADKHLGEVHFTVTGNEEALPHFQEGLLLLHSFEYEDARKAFLRAQEADPGMAMAYWGETMTYNHPLWRSQTLEDGQAALRKLAPSPDERQAKAANELEKDFLAAVDLLYTTDEATKAERDQAYADHLAGMYERYPGNQEVAAFYALSLLGAVPVGRDEEAYEHGARIAQGIIAENPNHPGALHYLIHSYDDPEHAQLALSAANSYSEVAPDAAHALHMPSHIYVAMGMWDEVVRSNIASFDASVKRMRRLDLTDNARSYHALHWLMYGRLQQGRFADAKDLMHDLLDYTQEEPDRGARSYIVSMKGNYLVDSEDWGDTAMTHMTTDLSDLNISKRAIFHFTRGWRAYLDGDAEQLSAVIADMARERKSAANRVTIEGLPMCNAAGSSRDQPNQLDIDQAHVMALQLEAMLADLQDDSARADALLRESTELESS
ncbi:MAG: hypothetical protein KDC54_07200, partial [Lewinella sp.]|nr:hypothetical protein [Lewinella sp.]